MSVSVETPRSHCPKCGHELNLAQKIRGQGAPQPGDMSFCVECAALMRFDAAMTLRPLSAAEEFRERMDHPEIDRIQAAILAANLAVKKGGATP